MKPYRKGFRNFVEISGGVKKSEGAASENGSKPSGTSVDARPLILVNGRKVVIVVHGSLSVQED